MKLILKTFLKRLFPNYYLHFLAYLILIRNPNSYFHLTGWIESLKGKKLVDNEGNYLPWMNFSITKLLEDKLHNNLDIFEYGSGYSTLFYAIRVQNVTSVEHTKEWLNILKTKIPNNVNLIFKRKDINGEYCRIIHSTNEKYDVIIIDGRDRVNCFKQSIKALSIKGIIILDDTHREKYQSVFGLSKEIGFKTLSIEGMKASSSGIFRTTIFYKKGNCLNI